MNQLAVAVYILATMSGLLVFGALFFIAIRKKEPLYQAYLPFFASYSLLVFLLTLGVYGYVNLIVQGGESPPVYYQNYLSILLLCLGLINYTMPRFYHVFADSLLGPAFRRVTLILALFCIPFTATLWMSELGDFRFVLFFLYFFSFLVVAGYCVLLILRSMKRLSPFFRMSGWFVIGYFFFSNLLGALEGFFLYNRILAEGYSFSAPLVMPLSYLGWNVLSVMFLYKREKTSETLLETDDRDVFRKRYAVSDREDEIINLLLRGYSNKEIAYELAISANTVRNHIYNIFQKTGAKNRVELLNKIRESAH